MKFQQAHKNHAFFSAFYVFLVPFISYSDLMQDSCGMHIRLFSFPNYLFLPLIYWTCIGLVMELYCTYLRCTLHIPIGIPIGLVWVKEGRGFIHS